MEDNGNQTGAGAGRESDAAGLPTVLKGFHLCGRLRAVRSRSRGKESTERGGTAAAENGGICGKSFKVQEEGVLSLDVRLVVAGCHKAAEQAERRNAAVVAGETSVMLCPVILHLIGVVFGVSGGGTFKAVGQPFAFYTGVKLLHAVKKGLAALILDPIFGQQFCQQILGSLVGQVGILHRFQRRLRGSGRCLRPTAGQSGGKNKDRCGAQCGRW